MRRREFLAGSIALAAGKTALPSSTWAQSAPRINRIIDAHCHIFNATDLPIEGFTKKIMVPKSAQTSELVARFADYPGALEALVHAITLQVKRAAPDLQSEIDTIDGFERDVEKKPTTDWCREQDRGHLRNVLRLIWFNWDVFSDRPLSLTEGIVLEVALEQIKLFLIQQIHEGFGKPDLTAEDREVLGGLTPYQVDAMADELYSRDDLLGRYIRWALLYTRNRYELAEELDQLHGKVAQKSRIVLMTPAIVDFSKWLEDDDELSIQDQVEVMARIACRKDGPRVHGFVGFDPLRQALYDHNRGSAPDGDPMALVRRAIEVNHIGLGKTDKVTGGFIGGCIRRWDFGRPTTNICLTQASTSQRICVPLIRDWGRLSAASSMLPLQSSTRGAVPIMCPSWLIPAIASGQTPSMRIGQIRFSGRVCSGRTRFRGCASTWLISGISTTPCSMPVHKTTSTNVGSGP
ncbi:MAG: hypothetical protein E6G78_09415 [Alphaproteobacteria bacterium]|nr:MAG: hypothetical protein E6G78_09415 [Alphaproteobacteria bacterium]